MPNNRKSCGKLIYRAHVKGVGDFTSPWVEDLAGLERVLTFVVPKSWSYDEIMKRTISEISLQIKQIGEPDPNRRTDILAKTLWCIFNHPLNGAGIRRTVHEGLRHSPRIYLTWTIDPATGASAFYAHPDGFHILDYDTLTLLGAQAAGEA